MGTVSNIVVGLQSTNTLKVGAYGAVEGDCVDVGFIKGGIKIEHEEEQYDVEVDQATGIVKSFIVKEGMKISLALAEVSLANLAIAMGYPTSAVASTTLSFGGKTTVTERALFINMKGPGPGTAKMTIYKAVPTGKTSPAYTKDKETLVDVEFKVLEDVSKTAEARYGTYVASGADTTAPTIALSTPTDGGTVLLNVKGIVVWTITETGSVLDENSIVYGDTVSIIDITTPASAALVAGTIVYSASAKTITFTPTSNWTASNSLQAIVTTGLKDASGNHLAAMKIEQFSVTVA